MTREEFTVNKDGKELKLAVRPPDYVIFSEADRVYAASVASMVRSSATSKKKILLRQELDSFLRDAGIWTENDQKQVQKLQKDIDKLLNKLRKGGMKLSEGRKIAVSILEKRMEIIKVVSKRQMLDDSTIESISENERREYMIYACTVDAATGQRYWEDFETMKEQRGSEVYQKAIPIAMRVIFNQDSSFEKDLPENRWLLKYNFIDKDLNYIDRKTGEFCDKDGNLLSQKIEEITREVSNISGEIVSESEFIDDETGEPVIVDSV